MSIQIHPKGVQLLWAHQSIRAFDSFIGYRDKENFPTLSVVYGWDKTDKLQRLWVGLYPREKWTLDLFMHIYYSIKQEQPNLKHPLRELNPNGLPCIIGARRYNPSGQWEVEQRQNPITEIKAIAEILNNELRETLR